MIIKVIIPILNPPETFFTDLIPSLLKQMLQTEILLINSGDAIPVGNYEVITIDKKNFNHANTRNLALAYASDYYLFMTQDAMPFDEFLLENLVRCFNHEDVVVSYARQIAYSDADPIEIFARSTNYPKESKIQSYEDLPHMGIKTFFSSDSCAMYQGEYFKFLGGFKRDNNTSEDMEFAARAILNNKKVAYCAEARVYHSHNFTLLQTWKRYRAISKFFAKNRWILKTVSQFKSTESTGIKQAILELRYLMRTAPHYIPRSIALSITKYIAFKA